MTHLETARQEALTAIRAAKEETRAARNGADLSADQQRLLEELYVDLDDQEDLLLEAALDQRIEALRLAGGKLAEVARKIGEDIRRLEKVAEVVAKAAKAIKALADIAGTVAVL